MIDVVFPDTFRRLLMAAALGLLAGCGVLMAGCGGLASSPAGASAGRVPVVAAESFWGSIARQLGGDRVAVSSIIVNPNIDPHAYEPSASDAIALARSKLAIVNGLGYDSWAAKLLAADPARTRAVLNVGDLLGLQQGDNPHQWYSPSSVQRVIDQLVADYKRLDPEHAAYFDRQRQRLQIQGLARYDQLRREIRARFAGVPVGYSESIFQPLGQDLGLRLMTPVSFATAIAEGSDVTAADRQTVDAQARDHAISVWVFNRQNATPDVQRVNQLAKGAGIPIATVTETLAPASDSFEQWQDAQLSDLLGALHRATGR